VAYLTALLRYSPEETDKSPNFLSISLPPQRFGSPTMCKSGELPLNETVHLSFIFGTLIKLYFCVDSPTSRKPALLLVSSQLECCLDKSASA
jgi:hypothetical protein